MKFRIIRNYDAFQPQVEICTGERYYWMNIGYGSYSTLENARKVCTDYKRMKEDKVVEEFEL